VCVEKSLRKLCREAGFDEVISKPIAKKVLEEILQTFFFNNGV